MQSRHLQVDIVLDDFMVSQLQSIAKEHGGQVPIHGRLFAQWLHYVFPRESRLQEGWSRRSKI